jgi:hypothetical protein
MNTEIEYNETLSQLTIKKSLGNYQGAPSLRQYQISFFGLKSEDIRTKFGCVWLNGKASRLTFDTINLNIEGRNFEGTKAKDLSAETMTLNTDRLPMAQDLVIKACQ